MAAVISLSADSPPHRGLDHGDEVTWFAHGEPRDADWAGLERAILAQREAAYAELADL